MPGEAVELGDGAAGGQQGILACFGRGTGMCATAFEGDVVPFVRQERYPADDISVGDQAQVGCEKVVQGFDALKF